ncbi:hypothetical protein BH11PAT4_BH11PAT4_2960 [soil metagenome]
MKRNFSVLAGLFVLSVFAQGQEVGTPRQTSNSQPQGWQKLFSKGQDVTIVNLGTMTDSEIKSLVNTIIPQGDGRLTTYASYCYVLEGCSPERRQQILRMLPSHTDRVNSRDYKAVVRPSQTESLHDFTTEYFCWMYFANSQGGNHIFRFGKVSHLEPIIVQAFPQAGSTVPVRLTVRLDASLMNLGNGVSAYDLKYFRKPLKSARCLNQVVGLGMRELRVDLPNQIDVQTSISYIDRFVSQPGSTQYIKIPVPYNVPSCAPLILANWQGRVDALPGNTSYREMLYANMYNWNGNSWSSAYCPPDNPIDLGGAGGTSSGPPGTGPNPRQNAGLDPVLGGAGVGGGTGPGNGGTPISIPPPRTGG